MRRWIALCVVAGLSFGAGCSRKSSDTAARLRVDGQAEVAERGDPWRPFTGERRMHDGDRVRMLAGSATISLRGDRQLELRPNAELTMALRPDGRLGPDLASGDLLVVAPDDDVLVATDEVRAVIQGGAARVSRQDGVVVRSYSASVALDSAGRSMDVPPLRQAYASVAQLVQGPFPVVYSPDDSWDQRFLAEAIQLDGDLQARSQGFSAQFPPTQGTAAFFRQIMPALVGEPAVDAIVGPPRPTGEELVGLGITVVGTRGDFAERWQQVIGFREQGAGWGLVAMDQGVRRLPLLEALDGAIGLAPSVFAGSTLVSAPAPPSPSAPATPSAPSTGSGTSSAAPAPTPPAPGQPAPPANENTGPLRTGIAPVDSAANSLVELLSGLLNSLGK